MNEKPAHITAIEKSLEDMLDENEKYTAEIQEIEQEHRDLLEHLRILRRDRARAYMAARDAATALDTLGYPASKGLNLRLTQAGRQS